MTWKHGEDLYILRDDKSITRRRLWIARILVFLMWLSPARSAEPSISYAVGSLLGLFVVYWILLSLLSKSTVAVKTEIEHEKYADAETKVLETLSKNEVTTKRELVNVALSKCETDDETECWQQVVKPYLDQQQNIRQMDDTGRRWRLIE